MPTFAQNPVTVAPGGFGVNHDYALTCSAGNTLIVMTEDGTPDITSVSLLGASGTFGPPDYSNGIYRVYSYPNLPSGVTGVRIVTSAGHGDVPSVLIEGTGQLAFDAAGEMPGAFTAAVSASVTTTAADDILVARWVAGSDTFTPDAGYANSATAGSYNAEYNSSALGAAGSETISGTFSGAIGGRGGIAVAYKSAGGGGGTDVLLGQAIL